MMRFAALTASYKKMQSNLRKPALCAGGQSLAEPGNRARSGIPVKYSFADARMQQGRRFAQKSLSFRCLVVNRLKEFLDCGLNS
jgi:hypothetical protein